MINLKNVTYLKQNGNPILEDLNCSLEKGKLYGLIAPNGEGKTTFMKLIAGLIFPHKGEIEINSINSKNRNVSFWRQLYFLPDHISKSNLTINMFVELTKVFYTNFDDEILKNAFDEFKISDDKKLNDLSLGEKKKFYISFAFATNTEILLMDEPSSGLDISSQKIFRKLLTQNIHEEKIILISSHNFQDVQNLADHLIVLKNKKIVFNTHVNEILNKYSFIKAQQALEHAIYSERNLNYYNNITKNLHNEESELDLELLYNAIQNNKL